MKTPGLVTKPKNRPLQAQQRLLHWLTLLELSDSPDARAPDLAHFTGFLRP
jgi:hypothetical protein